MWVQIWICINIFRTHRLEITNFRWTRNKVLFPNIPKNSENGITKYELQMEKCVILLIQTFDLTVIIAPFLVECAHKVCTRMVEIHIGNNKLKMMTPFNFNGILRIRSSDIFYTFNFFDMLKGVFSFFLNLHSNAFYTDIW